MHRPNLVAVLALAVSTSCGSSHANQPASESTGTPTSGNASASPSPSGETQSASTSPATSGGSEASPTPSEAPTASESPAAHEPDVALHVRSEPGARGFFANVDMERRDDGSLYFRGQEIGRLSHGQITTLDRQTVPLDGRISIGTRAHREHFTPQPDGSIRMDSGATLDFDPQGEVLFVRRGTPTPAHVRIEGYRPEVRHTAEMLLIYGVMKADLASR